MPKFRHALSAVALTLSLALAFVASPIVPVAAQTPAPVPSDTMQPAPSQATPAEPAPTHKNMMKGKHKAQTPQGEPVNINTATTEQLSTLPGIGPKRAQKIIDGRPYTKADDLVTKKVMPKKHFEKIKARLVV